mgnify:CR=1 FL=1
MTLMNLPLVPGLCKSTARGVEEIIRIDRGAPTNPELFCWTDTLLTDREAVKQTNKLVPLLLCCDLRRANRG